MRDNLPALAVLATFADKTAAEIACALLTEASISPDEPEEIEGSGWSVAVRSLQHKQAERAEVIVRSAGAHHTRTTTDDCERAAWSLNGRGRQGLPMNADRS